MPSVEVGTQQQVIRLRVNSGKSKEVGVFLFGIEVIASSRNATRSLDWTDLSIEKRLSCSNDGGSRLFVR